MGEGVRAARLESPRGRTNGSYVRDHPLSPGALESNFGVE